MLLAVVSAGLVLGIYLSASWDAGPVASLLFCTSAGALVLWSRLRRAKRAALLLAGVAFLFAGMARGACSPVHPLEAAQLQQLEGRTVTVTGMVASDPERVGNAYRLRIRGDIDGADQAGAASLRGDLLVTLKPWRAIVERRKDAAPHYGDVLRLQGTLSSLEPFGGFDFRSYLAQQEMLGVMRFPQATLVREGEGSPFLRALYSVRRNLAGALERSLPEPQASLAQAIFLGLRRELPDDVNEAFITTGTIHLLAVSGQHLTILLGVLLAGLQLLVGRRRGGLFLALAFLWFYAGLTGAAPPVVRAAVMGTLVLWARYEGRPGSGLLALSLASAGMVAIDPPVLLSVSFQLSVASMAGLVLVTPPLQAWMEERASSIVRGRAPLNGPARFLVAALAAGVGATLLTIPLTAFSFHRVSLIGVPVTLLALPVVPFLLVIAGAVAIAGVVWEPLAQVMAWVAWLPLTYLLRLVQVTAIPEWGSLNVGAFSSVAVWGYYLALLAGLWLLSRRRRAALDAQGSGLSTRRTALSRVIASDFAGRLIPDALWDRLPKKATAAALLIAGSLLWSAAVSVPTSSSTRVVVLNVGQGSAALIVTPSGKQVLVDGGPEPGRVLRALGDLVPFWDRTLDVVVLSHPDQDHVGGFPGVLSRYRTNIALESGFGASTAHLEWDRLVQRRARTRLVAVAGQQMDFGDGVTLTVLHPPSAPLSGTGADENNNSVVLKLTFGNVSFLLPGDIERLAEQFLVKGETDLRANVLLAPHHGSRTSSSADFLAAVGPAAIVISAGADNRFGHPHPETMASYARLPGPPRVFITAEHGTVVFTTDGRRLWVRTQGNPQ